MLKRFEVENYKNFKDKITVDFAKVGGYQFSMECITDNLIGKMLIYGRNATGKTNLGRAIMDIRENLGLQIVNRTERNCSNADSESNRTKYSYVFQFDGEALRYEYIKEVPKELCYEELWIDNQQIFLCDFMHTHFEFDNLHLIGADTINIDRYMESFNRDEETIDSEESSMYRVPFLRWLIGNGVYREDSIMIKLMDYVSNMMFITVGSNFFRPRIVYDNFFEYLEKDNELRNFEIFLNEMGVQCQLELLKLPDGQRQVYFKHNTLVPFFENASSGTIALTNIYRRLIVGKKKASFIYIDEFDAFYHYEMADNLVKYFKNNYPQSQIVMTSHNTNLMTNQLMRPDCLMILSRDGRLTALCDATTRELREGHNLEKMYISGEFVQYE